MTYEKFIEFLKDDVGADVCARIYDGQADMKLLCAVYAHVRGSMESTLELAENIHKYEGFEKALKYYGSYYLYEKCFEYIKKKYDIPF